MRYLTLMLLGLLLCASLASAQTFYNPTLLEFESPSHATVTLYRAEFFLAGAPTTGAPLDSADVPASKVTVGSPGPPIKYHLLMQDIPVFLPFGKSYTVRLVSCDDTMCSAPSEVTRELVRYTYCKASDTTVRPMTIATSAIPDALRNLYAPITVDIQSVRPVHAVNILLVGSGLPTFFFTGNDLRGTVDYSVGPLTRIGRFLVNVTAADEAGCSSSVGVQFITVK